MIVVADTSPVNYLILIQRIEVLPTLFGRILIPFAVQDEMLSLRAPAMVRAWAKNPPQWLDILSPSIELRPTTAGLDPGETEAIALAEKMHADWLLIDEAAGRDAAMLRGLQTIGTLGILREAHRARLINLKEEIDRLVSLGFRVSKPLIQLMLDSV